MEVPFESKNLFIKMFFIKLISLNGIILGKREEMRIPLKRYFLLAFLFEFISISIFNADYKSQWKGNIEKEGEVRVIKNPNEPFYGEIILDLDEDLSIGNENDENFSFFKATKPSVDSDGNILVLDKGNFRIQKFDKNGNYLQTIGHQGEGPGEFERPRYLYLDHQDNIYVGDGRHIDVFNKNGVFKISFKLNGFTYLLGITKEGNILAQINSRTTPTRETQEIVLISTEGKKIKTIVRFPFENPPLLRGCFYLSNPYTPCLYSCLLNEEFGVYGYSFEYRLFMFNSLGEIAYIIEKDERGEIFTRKERNELLDRKMKELKQSRLGSKYSRNEVKSIYKFPKYKPFFRSILKDNKDRIYVMRFKLLTKKDEIPVFDLFNKEGYYLYRIKIPLYKITLDQNSIKNGYVYTREYDSITGYIQIKRYKIKNWEQIKERI